MAVIAYLVELAFVIVPLFFGYRVRSGDSEDLAGDGWNFALGARGGRGGGGLGFKEGCHAVDDRKSEKGRKLGVRRQDCKSCRLPHAGCDERPSRPAKGRRRLAPPASNSPEIPRSDNKA